jgi:hypothetical protein
LLHETGRFLCQGNKGNKVNYIPNQGFCLILGDKYDYLLQNNILFNDNPRAKNGCSSTAWHVGVPVHKNRFFHAGNRAKKS